jgi:Uri superfamily endonuclease
MPPPDRPGTYVLVLHASDSSCVTVGRLGAHRFSPGWYTYVGSACGPGGLQARLSRHLRRVKASHWHIDYLRAVAVPVDVWYAVGRERMSGRRRECEWAETLASFPGAASPVQGFGSSDCLCDAHLQVFAVPPDWRLFSDRISDALIRDPMWCQSLAVK